MLFRSARLLYLAECPLDGGDARRVRARVDLAQEALRLLQQRGRVLEPLRIDRGRDAGRGRARPV